MIKTYSSSFLILAGCDMGVSLVGTTMKRELAKRIATTMVRLYGRQKHFVLSLSSRSQLEVLAKSFAECGCFVFWNEWANKIAVRVP